MVDVKWTAIMMPYVFVSVDTLEPPVNVSHNNFHFCFIISYHFIIWHIFGYVISALDFTPCIYHCRVFYVPLVNQCVFHFSSSMWARSMFEFWNMSAWRTGWLSMYLPARFFWTQLSKYARIFYIFICNIFVDGKWKKKNK